MTQMTILCAILIILAVSSYVSCAAKGTKTGGGQGKNKPTSSPGTEIEGSNKGKNEPPSVPPDGSGIEDLEPKPSGWGGPEIILDDASNGGADGGGTENEDAKTSDEPTDAESVDSARSTEMGEKQATVDKSLTEPRFFLNTGEWSVDFMTRFNTTISKIPTKTHCSKAAANLVTANRLITEIKSFDSRKEIYLKNNDYRSVSFMGYQEGRLNRLGLFLYPVTWSAVRCGAGILTNDCGQPWPTSDSSKTRSP